MSEINRDIREQYQIYGPKISELKRKHNMSGRHGPGGYTLTHQKFGACPLTGIYAKKDYEDICSFLIENGVDPDTEELTEDQVFIRALMPLLSGKSDTPIIFGGMMWTLYSQEDRLEAGTCVRGFAGYRAITGKIILA